MTAAIFGLSGPVLTPEEPAFFRDAHPAGYILFRRNIENRAQLRALTDALRSLHGRADLPILIDQEGGRVQRMNMPEWAPFPPGERFAALYERAPLSAIEAARANAQAIALTLAEVGITVNCLPLLDVRQPGANDIIGDRALGTEPVRVAAMGRAVIEGLRSGGVVGIVKHMPGHGRSMADSHLELPRVDATAEQLESDIAPFKSLNWAPMAMTAHILYPAWDSERCASNSPVIIEDIIRQRIGFDGWLMSDDLDMKALAGTPGEKARNVVAAGCDVALDCWGRMPDMMDIANSVGGMSNAGHDRLARAMATIAAAAPDLAQLDDLIAKRDSLLAYAA